MSNLGRPRKEINKKIFEELCKIQCTAEEICAVLGVSDKTLEKWCKENYINEEDGTPLTFSVVFNAYKLHGKMSIRRKQYALAEDSPRMAIWLGKQYLGQKDTLDVKADEEQLAKLDAIMQTMTTKAYNEDGDKDDGG